MRFTVGQRVLITKVEGHTKPPSPDANVHDYPRYIWAVGHTGEVVVAETGSDEVWVVVDWWPNDPERLHNMTDPSISFYHRELTPLTPTHRRTIE